MKGNKWRKTLYLASPQVSRTDTLSTNDEVECFCEIQLRGDRQKEDGRHGISKERIDARSTGVEPG